MHPHEVVVVAAGPVIVLDLAAPMHFFGHLGSPHYRARLSGVSTTTLTTGTGLSVDGGWELIDEADTVVVPGYAHAETGPPDPDLLRHLAEAAHRGARMISVCTGAFALGHAGLLDGENVTTHWRAGRALAETFPLARVDTHHLYIDSGRLLTSGGQAAGLDLCLHVLERDLGTAHAAAAARSSVLPLHRSGDQRQYIGPCPDRPDAGHLRSMTDWAEQNLATVHTVDDLAEHSHLSRRHLVRLFTRDVGVPPSAWLARTRLSRARELLESTDLTVDAVADRVGYRSVHTMRSAFHTEFGAPPGTFRRPGPRPG